MCHHIFTFGHCQYVAPVNLSNTTLIFELYSISHVIHIVYSDSLNLSPLKVIVHHHIVLRIKVTQFHHLFLLVFLDYLFYLLYLLFLLLYIIFAYLLVENLSARVSTRFLVLPFLPFN